jgi:hypothetical protein
MTDLRKSLGGSIFAVVALALCCLLIGQAATAKISDASKTAIADIISVSEVPLPTADDAVATLGARLPSQEAALTSEKAFLQAVPQPAVTEAGGTQVSWPAPAEATVPGDACNNPMEITIAPGDLGVGGSWTVDLGTVAVGNGNFLSGLGVERAFYFNFTASTMGTYQMRWCDDGTVPLVYYSGSYPCGRYVVYTDAVCGGPWYVSNLTPYPYINGRLCGTNLLCPAAAPIGQIGKDYFMQAGDEQEFEIEVRMGEPLVGTLEITYIAPVQDDDCVLPRAISGDGTYYMDLTGFTTDGPNTPYGSYGQPYEHNGWFRWYCTLTGTVSVSTCNTPLNACGTDLMLGIYPDGCFMADGTEFAFNDDAAACAGYQSAASFIAIAGQYYLITVGNWDYQYPDCDPPVVQLDISTAPLIPLNDLCANAQAVTIGRNFVFNLDATLDGPLANFCDPAGETCADVWYTYTATANGFATFDMCGGTLATGGVSGNPAHSWDSKLMVYDGAECLSVLPREVLSSGCSDDGCGWYGDGGLVEIPVVAGHSYLIRLAGWFNSTNACNPGGMGFGYMQVSESATTIRPVKTFCENSVPVALTAGVTTSVTGDYRNASWGNCPSSYSDGWLSFPWTNWEAATLPVCGNLRIDFCGTPESSGRVTYTSMPGATFLLTGCPCEGDFVAINGTTVAPAIANCTGYPTTADLNRIWNFTSLIPGDYYFPVSSYELGISTQANGSYQPAHGYQINWLATQLTCVVCTATANVNSCPPVSGATWIINVDFAGLHKVGIAGYGAGTNDCHAFEDHTAMTGGKVYRGFTYPLTVGYGRNGHTALTALDSADVWIDWNQNSGLAANQTELGERTRLTRVAETVVGTITIPMTAYLAGEGATGDTRMRIRLANAADGNNTACGIKVWGEVEDFTLVVADLECGDFDVNGDIDAADIAFLRNYYFGLGPAPDIWQRGDIDGDGFITIADIIALSDAAYRTGTLNCPGA